jgi:4-amino-4-deoxy-L-arabinose transferase-like glycosyltransferase
MVRYLVVYPIWHDEAFLAVNFLDRGYRDLLRPLEYAQVSPILFLWIELTVVRLLGFSEWSLRLFPALCGLASVILFRHLAVRLLRGIPLVLAVGIFATAFCPVRHSAEIKPYASDLLASLILLTLAVGWWRVPTRSRAWWALAAVVPILLAVSYPAVFVAAGLSVALAPTVFRLGVRRVRFAFLVYNVILIASFLSIYFAATVFQSSALREGYRWGYWHAAFPPWAEPLCQVRSGIELSATPVESRHECGLSLSPGDVCPPSDAARRDSSRDHRRGWPARSAGLL